MDDQEIEEIVRLAGTASSQGRLKQAESLARKALAVAPHHIGATCVLAMILGRAGQARAGIGLLQGVLERGGDSVEACNTLAALLRGVGDFAGALEAHERAICLDPTNAGSLGNLALTHIANGQLRKAEYALTSATELKTDDASLYYQLGIVESRLRKHAMAAEAFRRSTKLAPSIFASLKALGDEERILDNLPSAIGAYRQALALEPGNVKLSGDLADALVLNENYEEASATLDQAISLDPSSIQLGALKARLLQLNGRFEEAAASAEQILQRDPKNLAAFQVLTSSRRLEPRDRQVVERMALVLRDSLLKPNEREALCFAVGKGFDDLGEFGRAMAHFDKGNQIVLGRLQSEGKRFVPAKELDRFSRIIYAHTRESIANGSGFASQSSVPVFVVGMIRSGTTLAEQILSSHADISAGGEIPFWPKRMPILMDLGERWASSEKTRDAVLEYEALLASIGAAEGRVVDKMPANFLALGMLATLFPKGRAVVMRRHPLDNAISIYTTKNDGKQLFAHRREDIVCVIEQYERLLEHWRQVLPSNWMLEVNYDDLVRNRDEVVREMVRFCGLPWDSACLRHEENRRIVRTPSFWQVKQGIYQTSVGRWKNYQPWLGDLLRLGTGELR